MSILIDFPFPLLASFLSYCRAYETFCAELLIAMLEDAAPKRLWAKEIRAFLNLLDQWVSTPVLKNSPTGCVWGNLPVDELAVIHIKPLICKIQGFMITWPAWLYLRTGVETTKVNLSVGAGYLQGLTSWVLTWRTCKKYIAHSLGTGVARGIAVEQKFAL